MRFFYSASITFTLLALCLFSSSAQASEREPGSAATNLVITPGFKVDIASVYTKKFMQADFDISGMDGVTVDASGRLELVTTDDKSLVHVDLPGLDRNRKQTIRMDFNEVEPGDYILKMSLFGKKNKVLATKSVKYMIPEPPEWLNNKLGISDNVPIPFEDVRVEGTNVNMWERTYVFENSIFPTRIVNQDAEQLARPIELVLEEDGLKYQWENISSRVTMAKPTEAVIDYKADSKAASVIGTVRIEYDGWAMYDFILTPKDTRTITALRIEIPFHREEASYLRAVGPITKWAEEKWYTALIGDIKDDTDFDNKDRQVSYMRDWMPNGWQGVNDFMFQVYVGNDDRGFLIVQDTDEDRFLKGGNLEIQYEGDTTVVQIHLINKPTKIDMPLRYRIALAATPFKKYRYDLEYLISMVGGHNPQWVIDNNLMGWVHGASLWKWGRIEKDFMPNPKRPNLLKQATANYKRADMLALINTTNCFCATPYEPFDIYRDEWVHIPPYDGYVNLAGTDVSLVMVSPQSSFFDFYLWWVKKRIDEDGIGGLYFDLTGPAGNANPLSGGGWTNENGERHMTSNIFALRELYKRLYTLLKEEGAKRGTEFYIFQHSSAGPITAFADQITKGEGYNAAKDWSCVTPNLFRATSLRQLGTPYTFFVGPSTSWIKKPPWPLYNILAKTLINGSLTTPLETGHVATHLFPLWKWRKEFGMENAEWVPWYKKDPYINLKPDSLFVSLWKHPGKVMIVASNLTDKTIEGIIKLDVERLSLPDGTLKAAEIHGMDNKDMKIKPDEYPDNISDHPGPVFFHVNDGEIPVKVSPQNYSVIRLPME